MLNMLNIKNAAFVSCMYHVNACVNGTLFNVARNVFDFSRRCGKLFVVT